MKIIQVVPFLHLGGAEIMCENLVYELSKKGHSVIIVSLYDKKSVVTERCKNFGVNIIYLNKKKGFDISLYKKLYKLFKAEQPDVIHTHLYVAKYVFPVANRLKIKTIHTIHSIATKESSKFSRIFNKFFFKYRGIIPVALSENIKQTIIEEYKLEPHKVPIVLNGIDLAKCKVKQNYDFDGNFKIVHVGSFQEVKNHIGMLKAFEIFHNKFKNTELHFIGDGLLRDSIEHLVSEKHLSRSVVFHGMQANVHEFLHKMDVFTLCSFYEGISMSIAEAMGTGLPIVATRVGGTPDMINSENSLLVPVEVNAIAQAFETYYCDEALRVLHGQKLRDAAENFSSFNMAKQYEKIYG